MKGIYWFPFFIVAVLASLSLHAQTPDDLSRWSIGVSGGFSAPIGNFAFRLKEPYVSHYGLSGRPMVGPIAECRIDYAITPKVVVSLRGNYARMATEGLKEEELFPYSRYTPSSGGFRRTGYSQEQGQWEVGQLFGALGFRSSHGGTSATLHIEGGAQWTHSPEVEVIESGRVMTVPYTDVGPYTSRYFQPALEVWSFVAGGGVDLGIALTPSWAVHLGGAVHSTAVTLPYRWEGPNGYFALNVEQPITTLQFTVGVNYRFPPGK